MHPVFASIRWGFTSQNFLAFIPPSFEAAGAFLAETQRLGLQWIELRDPDASLTPSECAELARQARHLGLEVTYSAQRGLLAEDFWPVFERALANAAQFSGGPGTVRGLAQRGSGAVGWSDSEFAHMLGVANAAMRHARAQGLSISIENADAALFGQTGAYRGMEDLLDALDSDIQLQLDTANLFTGPVAVTAEEASGFIRKFAARVSYLHLKTAAGGTALPVLADNPLGFGDIFHLLAGRQPLYVVVELGNDQSAEAIRANFQKSLAYLDATGLRRRGSS